jgi:DNA (cytosine-5)-methyltransferase 1
VKFGSVCSGIEAASVAWTPLGWECAWVAEIEPFASAVLAHHYPDVPNHGDFTRIGKDVAVEPIDVLVGGTPCQSFSVAGKRAGLDDPRGNLTLEYLALAGRLRPRWLAWENVPGVLSDDGGRTFGAILGTLAELGYGFAYCVLDAQYRHLAQRRERVFVVGHLGDWRGPAAVLLEPTSLSGNPAPRRQTREDVAADIASGVAGSLGGGGQRGWSNDLDASEDGTGRGTPLVAMPLGTRVDRGGSNREAHGNNLIAETLRSHPRPGSNSVGTLAFYPTEGRDFVAYEDVSPAVKVGSGHGGSGNPPGVAFAENQRGEPRESDIAAQLTVGGGKAGQGFPAARQGMSVRRLTPRECERLQGFPDDYTQVPYRGKPASDGPRYRVLGNSMAVTVMRLIGERIQMLEASLDTDEAVGL